MNNNNFSLVDVFGGFKSWRIYIYGLVLLVCFLLFQQGDLTHTTKSSYAYINGNYLNFYDYNKLYIGGNDYLPLIYVIFAIWNIPLYFFGVTVSPLNFGDSTVPVLSVSSPLLLIAWAKILLVVFFFGSVKIISKISEILAEDVAVEHPYGPSIFATSPIAIFVIFIFSQYDIIGVFFALLGFYFYLKNNLLKFALLFSLAISFKYFALFIYIPLVLIAEKRILSILKLFAIGFAATFIQLAVYWGSDIFRAEIFSLASGKVSGAYANGFSYLNPAIYAAGLYIFGCVYLFYKQYTSYFEMRRVAVFACIAGYGLMFLAVVWHPQWLIIVMPFFALSYGYIRNKRLFSYVELIGVLAFIWICVNGWPRNVDVGMANLGILRGLIPAPQLIISDFFVPNYSPLFNGIFYVYLFSPLLFLIFEGFIMKYEDARKLGMHIAFVRFFWGTLFFLIPALVCIFIPYSSAIKINKDAFVNTFYASVVNDLAEIPIGEVVDGKNITQTFKAKFNGLSAVSVKMATYARLNRGSINFSVRDDSGKVLRETNIESKSLLDNVYYNFKFDPILDSKDKTFYLNIRSDGASIGNAVTAWASIVNNYTDGGLYQSGVLTGHCLAMTIYFDPKYK
jgi:hypothetical protein